MVLGMIMDNEEEEDYIRYLPRLLTYWAHHSWPKSFPNGAGVPKLREIQPFRSGYACEKRDKPTTSFDSRKNVCPQ